MWYTRANQTQFFKRDSKMKNALALLLTILVSCFAKAQSVQSVLTVPSVGPEFSNSMAGGLESLTTDFDELADGTYAVRVYGRYTGPRHPAFYVNAGIFRPTVGSIVRNGDQLFWVYKGQSVQVATTSFWSTFPLWPSSPGAVHLNLSQIHESAVKTYQVSVTIQAQSVTIQAQSVTIQAQ